jgi:excinuclease ABC subunit A
MISAMINIKGASENNLRSIDVDIPHNKLTVITGVSGSGKSSLAFDIVFKEGQRRYLETFSSRTRQSLGKLMRPEVDHISGLRPAVSVDQKTVIRNSRSTVGTLSEIYDFLRLLFARKGASSDTNLKLNRNLFSFNSEIGACPACKGLGVTDQIDENLFIKDENLSIREGALTITTPSGYIIYSQVTMDVMDQVCKSEGFDVDIPWKDLNDYQKKVVLYGSDKIKIPFGKHTLESRMKWSGITAKPREEGYYKGIIPVMEEILKRDRNKNILRFARTVKCSACQGSRLSDEALSVYFESNTIADMSEMTISELNQYFKALHSDDEVVKEISKMIIDRTDLIVQLGLGYLTINRESTTLAGGEAQRLRLANQVGSNLQGLIYVLDEPSIGLHDRDNERLIRVLRKLVSNGNTVVVVEHDETIIRNADWVIDIGLYAGKDGGLKLFSGTFNEFIEDQKKSLTARYLNGSLKMEKTSSVRSSEKELKVLKANRNNLKDIDVTFKLGCFNVITGVSGAGKSSLIEFLLDYSLKKKMNGAELIKKVIHIDQSPIGRTPRSNPATYTKVFDYIRDLFAKQEMSIKNKWKKNHFSFNVVGGRCEKCQGAGYEQVGMHFMGDVEIQCSDCQGKRFSDETLMVKVRDKNIYDVLEMQVDEACDFFSDHPKIKRILDTINLLGLGYITLGQSATTFSGGEAQRIKLATELSRSSSGNTLYILDEPSTGLHFYDIDILLNALNNLVDNGNTVIVIEHNMEIINSADHIIDLGPESDILGGNLVFEGSKDMLSSMDSPTGIAFNNYLNRQYNIEEVNHDYNESDIYFHSVSTNNLKNININIPRNKITALVGVSGSGKSSFAFNTLFSEGQNRFAENLGAYARSQLSNKVSGEFEYCTGLTATIAVSQRSLTPNPRSTVGTITEIYDYYRLLFARFNDQKETLLSSVFSFNKKNGACSICNGIGKVTTASIDKLITHSECSILNGAIKGTKTGQFYGDPYGQYVALLKAVGKKYNIDFEKPYKELDQFAKDLILDGAGSDEFDAEWHYKRKNREGVQKFRKSWDGLISLINEEYKRKHADKRGESMMNVMMEVECAACEGSRLNSFARSYTCNDFSIDQLSKLSAKEALRFFNNLINEAVFQGANDIINEILKRLEVLSDLGLSYLSMDRNSETLSGGESQRLRLATLVSSELTGITYVLDEPTMGLHPRDYSKLFEIIQRLKELGNTIVVVEHDPYIIKSSDHIIEFGPGSGRHGGEIVFEGNLESLLKNNASATADIFFEKEVLIKNQKTFEDHIIIKGAFANNLKNIDVKLPVSGFTVVKGVSGAGKTSLIFDVLLRSFNSNEPVNCISIEGMSNIPNVLDVRQRNMSGSILSNILTYTGIYDDIRKLYGESEQAKALKLNKSHFSFNLKGGRCETCKGIGEIRIPMDLIPDIWQTCDQCDGKRFKDMVLECKLSGYSINELLGLSLNQLFDLFAKDSKHNKLVQKLKVLVDIGMGYIISGQHTSSLSGGEQQRLLLSKELMRSKAQSTLILLDEPTLGLHYRDIKKLIKLFEKLIQSGQTLVVIDHHDLFDHIADHIIELGPVGGDEGGYLIN